MVDLGLESYELSRCKFYRTTIYSCTCTGYKFRRNCRHVEFMRRKLTTNKEGQKDDQIYSEALASVASRCEAVVFVEKYGEEMLEKMKVIGDVFERHGKLYKLE